MELSKETTFFLSRCWGENDERRCTNFYIGEKQTHEGAVYKPTENTYEELVKYQAEAKRPLTIFRSGNYVNITGGVIVK